MDLGSMQNLLFDHKSDRDLRIRFNLRAQNAVRSSSQSTSLCALEDHGYEICFRLVDDATPAIRFVEVVFPGEKEPCPVERSASGRLSCRRALDWNNPKDAYEFLLANRKNVLSGIKKQIELETLNACLEKGREDITPMIRAEDSTCSGMGSDIGRESPLGGSVILNRIKKSAIYVAEKAAMRRKYAADLAFYSKEFTSNEFTERSKIDRCYQAIEFESFIPGAYSSGPLVLSRDCRMYIHRFDEIVWYSDTKQWELLCSSARARRDELKIKQMLPQQHVLNGCVAQLSEDINKMISSLTPIGPLREIPERWDLLSWSAVEEVGFAGEWWPQIAARDKTMTENVNKWLRKLAGFECEVTRPSNTVVGDIFMMQVRDTRCANAPLLGVADVGCGVAQVLPLIAQSLISREKLITVEQPEVHIHWKMQADLASLFAHSVRENANRFLIETHSEHLLLRIMRLMRAGELKPEDVCVLYVDRTPDGSRIRQLRLDEEGLLMDPWPGGFFPERSDELEKRLEPAC